MIFKSELKSLFKQIIFLIILFIDPRLISQIYPYKFILFCIFLITLFPLIALTWKEDLVDLC